MTDRTAAFFPRTTTVKLGEHSYIVHEAKLIDLRALQAWIDQQPRDATAEPPIFDSDEGMAFLDTPEGLLAFMRVALARGNPNLTDADLLSLCKALSEDRDAAAAWFQQVRAAFFGPTKRDFPSWGEAVYSLIDRTGWTLPEITDLTVTQFMFALNVGK